MIITGCTSMHVYIFFLNRDNFDFNFKSGRGLDTRV